MAFLYCLYTCIFLNVNEYQSSLGDVESQPGQNGSAEEMERILQPEFIQFLLNDTNMRPRDLEMKQVSLCCGCQSDHFMIVIGFHLLICRLAQCQAP